MFRLNIHIHYPRLSSIGSNRGEKVWQQLPEIAAREHNQHSSPMGSKITMQKLGILKLKVGCC